MQNYVNITYNPTIPSNDCSVENSLKTYQLKMRKMRAFEKYRNCEMFNICGQNQVWTRGGGSASITYTI